MPCINRRLLKRRKDEREDAREKEGFRSWVNSYFIAFLCYAIDNNWVYPRMCARPINCKLFTLSFSLSLSLSRISVTSIRKRIRCSVHDEILSRTVCLNRRNKSKSTKIAFRIYIKMVLDLSNKRLAGFSWIHLHASHVLAYACHYSLACKINTFVVTSHISMWRVYFHGIRHPSTDDALLVRVN